MGGRGSTSYKWLQKNISAMVKQIDVTVELDAMDKVFFNAYPNETITKKFTADSNRDTNVIIKNINGDIKYDIYKKVSPSSKKYEKIIENVNGKRAKDTLAKLLKIRYEKYMR